MKYRDVAQIVSVQEALEGAGVRIRRTIGTPELDYLDPFLLLDDFKFAEGADSIVAKAGRRSSLTDARVV